MKSYVRVKIPRGFKAVHFKDRQPFELEIGKKYFFSYGSGKIYEGILMSTEKKQTLTFFKENFTWLSEDILMEENRPTIERFKVVLSYSGGNAWLWNDELGRDHLEAARNEITW
jgi:hypothetical protein